MPTRPRFQGIGTFHLFGIQAAILAICGVLGSLVASFIAYKLFIKKGGLNEK